MYCEHKEGATETSKEPFQHKEPLQHKEGPTQEGDHHYLDRPAMWTDVGRYIGHE